MIAQGSLFPHEIAQEPTIHQREGVTAVFQCAWCGALICTAVEVELGRCPACEFEPKRGPRWWRQPVKVGPFRQLS